MQLLLHEGPICEFIFDTMSDVIDKPGDSVGSVNNAVKSASAQELFSGLDFCQTVVTTYRALAITGHMIDHFDA